MIVTELVVLTLTVAPSDKPLISPVKFSTPAMVLLPICKVDAAELVMVLPPILKLVSPCSTISVEFAPTFLISLTVGVSLSPLEMKSAVPALRL